MVQLATGNTTASSSGGVALSFIGFDQSTLYSIIEGGDDESLLETELDRVSAPNRDKVNNGEINADTAIRDYFTRNDINGSYLIAEIFIEKVIDKEMNKSTNKIIINATANGNVKNYKHDNVSKLSNAVSAYNQNNGSIVYNTTTGEIVVLNPNALTYVEKSQILISHTGNTSIFAFAAEIEYHAEMNRDNILPNWWILPDIEYSTIVANMQISGYSENTSTASISSNGVVQNEIQTRLSTQIANHKCAEYIDLLNEEIIDENIQE